MALANARLKRRWVCAVYDQVAWIVSITDHQLVTSAVATHAMRAKAGGIAVRAKSELE